MTRPHVIVRCSPTHTDPERRWYWACISATCPGERTIRHAPTHEGALWRALDHIDEMSMDLEVT